MSSYTPTQLNSLPADIGRRRLKVQPEHMPPIIENRPCIYHFLPLPPNIFWFAHPIFLTRLVVYASTSRGEKLVGLIKSNCFCISCRALQSHMHGQFDPV